MSRHQILLVSQRQRSDGFGMKPGYVPFAEAEDVLASCVDLDTVLVDRSIDHPKVRTRRAAGRVLRRVKGPAAILPTTDLPGRARRAALTPPRDHYDLVLFVGFTLWDLPLLERAVAARESGDRIVAWFPEAWPSELDDDRLAFEPFEMANALFVGMRDTAAGLARLTNRPVRHLMPAVDTLRFGAGDPDGHRPIDVLGIGRRDPALHRELLAWSRKTGRLYVYDTLSGVRVSDVAAHRDNLADTYLRTNVALTHFAKWNEPEVVRGCREIPGRYFEALASGAMMTGHPPDPDEQIELVGEPLVRAIPADAAAAVECIAEQVAAPDDDLRRHQMQLALLGQDWAHRWAAIFDAIGLDRPPGLRDRIDQLAARAEALER